MSHLLLFRKGGLLWSRCLFIAFLCFSVASCTKSFPGSEIFDLSVLQSILKDGNATPGGGSSPYGLTLSGTTTIITFEAAASPLIFNVALSLPPTAGSTTTVTVTSSNGGEGSVSLDNVTYSASVVLTFTDLNWSSAQSVYVLGVDDVVADGDVAYTIGFGTITSTDPNYNGMTPGGLAALNIDNDSGPIPGITVMPSTGLTTRESGTSVLFGVVLQTSPAPATSVTIPLASSNGGEGTVAPASLVFDSTNWNVPQVVTVTGADDFVQDGNTPYSIVTGAAVSSDAAYSGLNAVDVSLSNIDDDIIGIALNKTSLNTSENGGTAVFTIQLNSAPTANVTIPLSSNDVSEGTVSPANLTFTTVNWSSPQTVTVTAVNDTLIDGDITYSIVTGAAVSGDTNYSGLNGADVTVVNFDNDSGGAPAIHITPVTGLLTSEQGSTAQFGIVLQSAPSANVTIALSTDDATEGNVGVASVTFTPANWDVPQTVTVTGVNDAIQDSNIGYSIVTAAATSTDPNYSGMNPVDVSLTNIDDDTAGVTVSTGGASGITTEGGGTTGFSVVLNSQPTANVTLGVTLSDATEGTITAPFAGTTGTLTFTTANWNVAQNVTVAGVDDALADGNIAYTVNFGTTASGDPNYNGTFTPSAINLMNTDNDAPAGITVTAPSGTVTSEIGATATLWVVLDSQPTANVTVGGSGNITSSDTGEITVSPTTLVFTPANWSTPQSVTLSGQNDVLADGLITVTIGFGSATSTDAGYNGMSPPSLFAYNLDDEALPKIFYIGSSTITTSEKGTTAQVQIVLGSKPGCASLTLGPMLSSDTTEGTVSPANLTFTSANWNDPQTVTVTGQPDALIDGSIVFPVSTGTTGGCSDAKWNGLSLADISVTNTDYWPLATNYTRTQVAGAYTSISGTGTPITFTNSTDDDEFTIPIGFNFAYLDPMAPYANINVGTNGYATFDGGFNWTTAIPYGTSGSRANVSLFTTARPNLVLAPWWDDMYLILASSKVYYQTTGVMPNRVLTIEWMDNQYYGAWSVCGGTEDVFNYQVKLYETTNVIEFVYGSKTVTCGSTTVSASMGISDDTGGDLHFRDAFDNTNVYTTNANRTNADFPASGTIIRFTP